MPRCASKVTLHVYAIDRAPVKERRDCSTPCGFGNFWCLRFALNVWPRDALRRSAALRVSLPTRPLSCPQPSSFQWFPCCFFLPLLWSCWIQWSLLAVPFGWFSLWLNVFRFSLLFLCLLPLSPRRPSATEIREEKLLCRQKTKP